MAEPGDEIEALDPDDIDVEQIVEEERAATRRLSAIEAGRKMGGSAGAGLAGAMLAVSEIYEGPPKDDDVVAVAEHPGEPGDIDVDGIEVTVGEVDVWAPPPAPPSTETSSPEQSPDTD